MITDKPYSAVIFLYTITREIRKTLVPHENTLTNVWPIFPIFTPRFSGITVVLYGDKSHPSFCVALLISIEGLTRYMCYRSKSSTTYLN